MSHSVERFPYPEPSPGSDPGALPFLPITLQRSGRSGTVNGLVDSGATVNVLPYDAGIQLGAVWDQQTTSVRLSGNLARLKARGIVLEGGVGKLATVRLVFAWVRGNEVPVILGRMNFFLAFGVAFFRSQGYFEIHGNSS